MTLFQGPKRSADQAPGSVAFVYMPELVDTVNSVVGIEHVTHVSHTVCDYLQRRIGALLFDLEAVDNDGFYCWIEADTQQVLRLMERVSREFTTPMEIGFHLRDAQGNPHRVSRTVLIEPFIGICSLAEARPDVARDRARLCAQWSLRDTRKRVFVYSEVANSALSGEVRAKQAVMSAIRQAILTQFYQPQIDYQSGLIVGLEALLRPPQGADAELFPDLPSNPGYIVWLAERAGMMDELTALVWEQALKALTQLDRLAPDNGITMSVNMGGDYLVEYLDNLVERIEALREPERVTLEITEEAALDAEKMQALKKATATLRELGVRVAVDDFGVGHSNIARVQNLNFDELKIDKSLIQQIPGSEHNINLLLSMIEFANNRQVTVVTEGVETTEQWDFLKAAGATIAQGFLMARPRPLMDVIARVQNQQKWADAGEG